MYSYFEFEGEFTCPTTIDEPQFWGMCEEFGLPKRVVVVRESPSCTEVMFTFIPAPPED